MPYQPVMNTKKWFSVRKVFFVGLLTLLLLVPLELATSMYGREVLECQAADIGSTLQSITYTIDQFGFSESTLSRLKSVEEQVYKTGANNQLFNVTNCYYTYVYNLLFLHHDKELTPVLTRWVDVFKAVCEGKKDVTVEFAGAVDVDSIWAFYTILLCGPEYDPLLLRHTQNMVAFYEKALKTNPQLPRAYYQSALESYSYALLYNRKFDEFANVALKTESIEDQLTGKLPKDFLPIIAYKNLIQGDSKKCEQILNNFISAMGNTTIKMMLPYRTGINVVIDDLYQLKKRNIGGKVVDNLLAKLPTPLLLVTQVASNGVASRAGIRTGDMLSKYNGEKCLSYYHFMDLVLQNKAPKVEVEIIRGKQTLHLTVAAGRMGMAVEEVVKK